jgi:hypothetical protein
VIVTASSARTVEFEALMAEWAIPWRWIGRTGGDGLRISAGSETLIDVDTPRIDHAWRSGFERHMA